MEKKKRYLPINPVVGIMGGTPFDIIGTLAPTDIGTGPTIPILGMPVGKTVQVSVRGVGMTMNTRGKVRKMLYKLHYRKTNYCNGPKFSER